MLTIDKDVPIPATNHKRVYPLEDMAVGDSFFVPVPGEGAEFERRRKRRQQAMSTICRTARARKIGTFTSRQVEGGVRVWRIT